MANDKQQTWNDFARVALGVARTLGTYGWDKDVAAEYTRLLMHKCPIDRAIAELRRVASDENRLASATEIINSARGPVKADRWIVVERNVIRPGGSRIYSYAMKVPPGGDASDYVRPGEKLVYDSEAERLKNHGHQEIRARQQA